MAHIIQKKDWQISENLATPESAYLRRREFIQGTALTSLVTVSALYGCGPSTLPKSLPGIEWNDTEKSIYPAKRNSDSATQSHRLNLNPVGAIVVQVMVASNNVTPLNLKQIRNHEFRTTQRSGTMNLIVR